MLDKPIMDRLNQIFAESILTDEREMTAENLAFLENHIASYTEFLKEKAIRTIAQFADDHDMVAIVFESVYRAAFLEGILGYQSYAKFRTIMEKEGIEE